MQTARSAGGDLWKQQRTCQSFVIRSEPKHTITLTSFTLSYLDSLQEFIRPKIGIEQKLWVLGLIEAGAALSRRL